MLDPRLQPPGTHRCGWNTAASYESYAPASGLQGDIVSSLGLSLLIWKRGLPLVMVPMAVITLG